MNHFTAEDTFIIVGIVIAYILFTTWLTFRIRSKNSGDFMEGSRAMPAFIVGILLMSEYIGAKSTIGTAQAAFESGIAASWSVLGAAIGFPLFGLILVKRIYNTGKITISGAIAEKYGNSTKNIISLIMIYALLLVNVGNYVSGAAAISTVLKVNLPVAAFITAIVSTFLFRVRRHEGRRLGHHVTQRVKIRRSADHSGFCPVQNRRLLADDGEDAGLLLDMGWQHWCWHDLRLAHRHYRLHFLHPVCHSGH